MTILPRVCLGMLICLWTCAQTAGGTAAGAPDPPAPAPSIRVGVIGPLSGSNFFAGIAQRNAVILAAEEVNARGGIRGRRIEVLAEDDRGLPGNSLAGVGKMIDSGAAAVLGAINSSCTLADMDLCAHRKVPLLTSSSTATRVTSLGNRWIFRCIESDLFRMAALSEYLVEELNLKRIGVLYEDDEYGRGLRADLTRSLEKYALKLTCAYPFRRGQKDFAEALAEAQRRDVQAVGLFGITADNVRLAAIIHQAGGAYQLFSPDVNEIYLDVEGLDGLVATDSFYLLMDKPNVREFISRYRGRFNLSPGTFGGRAYDAARILFQALERAAAPEGEPLREALFATENFPGVTGDFNFKSNGDVVKKIHIITIHNSQFVSAKEQKTRSSFRRWLIYLVPALMVLSLLVYWGLGTTRRMVQQRLRERALREFHPIRVNPYIVGNPVREKEMFFGREDDFHFIRKNLERGDSGVCIVVCGERRSGKTSILYQILNGRLGADFLPVLIDLQLYGNLVGAEGFFALMRDDIADNLKRNGLAVPESAGGESTGVFESFVGRLIRQYPGRKVLLLLDEYEIIETLVDQGALHPAAVNFLAGLLERYPTLSYVLTGSTRLEERRKPYWEHLIAKSLYRKISFLTPADTQRLIREPLQDLVFYEDSIPDRICRLTSGQPFYTQAICMNVVDHLNEVRRNLVTPADLDSVVAQLVENPLPQMLYFWESFGRQEKLLLSLLADAITSSAADAVSAAELAVSAAELMEHARRQQLPIQFELADTHTVLENLFTREVLSKKGKNFQFRMDLFREWVQRDHSPWQIIGEENRR